jgi:hypothetical protein
MSILGKAKTFFEKVGTEIEKLFGGKASLEQKIQSVIAFTAPLVNTIVTLADPSIAPQVSKAVTVVQSDLATISTVVQGSTVVPGSTGAQTAITALNSIKTNLNDLLTEAGVKNTAKFAQISAAANLVIGEVEAILANMA